MTAAVFALGYLDPATGSPRFVSRSAGLGNLLPTPHPASAGTWDSMAELCLWADELPEGTKESLDGKTLLVFPFTFVVGEPVQTVVLKRVGPEPAETTSADTCRRKAVASPSRVELPFFREDQA